MAGAWGHGALDLAALALVVVALVGALERRLAPALVLLTLQGCVLTIAAALLALDHLELHGVVAVAITIAVKVVAIPWVLFSAVRDTAPRHAPPLAVPTRTALAGALLVILAAFYVVGPLTPPGLSGGAQALAAAVAVMLLGLYAMMVQGNALAQVLALVTMENGLYLAALTATRGFPLAVELAVALDALVAAVIMALLSRQIHRTFRSTNTDILRSLRG